MTNTISGKIKPNISTCVYTLYMYVCIIIINSKSINTGAVIKTLHANTNCQDTTHIRQCTLRLNTTHQYRLYWYMVYKSQENS